MTTRTSRRLNREERHRVTASVLYNRYGLYADERVMVPVRECERQILTDVAEPAGLDRARLQSAGGRRGRAVQRGLHRGAAERAALRRGCPRRQDAAGPLRWLLRLPEYILRELETSVSFLRCNGGPRSGVASLVMSSLVAVVSHNYADPEIAAVANRLRSGRRKRSGSVERLADQDARRSQRFPIGRLIWPFVSELALRRR